MNDLKERIAIAKLSVGDSVTFKGVESKMKWSLEYVLDLMSELKTHTTRMLPVGNDYEDFGEDITPSKEDLDINIDLTVERVEENEYKVTAEITAEWKNKKDTTVVEDTYTKEEIMSVFDTMLDK